jgi:hypothetical protein
MSQKGCFGFDNYGSNGPSSEPAIVGMLLSSIRP